MNCCNPFQPQVNRLKFTNADTVENSLEVMQICYVMKESIPERNHTVVRFVGKRSPERELCKDICLFIWQDVR